VSRASIGTTAWHDDLRLQSTRLASELSLATTQILTGIGMMATVMVMFTQGQGHSHARWPTLAIRKL